MGHIGLSADITDRKREDQALQFQSSLIRAIQEVSLDGILVVTDKLRIATYNQKFKEVWQLEHLDIPDNAPDYFVGDQGPLVLSAALERVKDPDPFLKRVNEINLDPNAKDQCEIELKDGRTLERYSTGLRSEGGLNLGRVWFFRDISERKRAAEALHESEERFRAIFRHSPVGKFLGTFDDRIAPGEREILPDAGILGGRTARLLLVAACAPRRPQRHAAEGDPVVRRAGRIHRGRASNHPPQWQCALECAPPNP